MKITEKRLKALIELLTYANTQMQEVGDDAHDLLGLRFEDVDWWTQWANAQQRASQHKTLRRRDQR